MNNQDSQLLVMIPKELHTRAKVIAVKTGQPLKKVVEKLLADWTKQQEQKLKK